MLTNADAEQVQLMKTLEKKPVNEIHWSPVGHHVVLAGTYADVC